MQAQTDNKGGTQYRRRRVCVFCTNNWAPDYKNAALLRRFISERGRIIGHARTGTCTKHQRLLTKETKRARHIALLPFATRVS